MFEIRKNLDLRKILVTPKIFLKSRFHCTAPQAAQIAQLVKCMFPNVAGRPAVYKTGGRVGKVDSKISQERGH